MAIFISGQIKPELLKKWQTKVVAPHELQIKKFNGFAGSATLNLIAFRLKIKV